ncbi:hypothetical protein HWI79_2171 [Cryptosporidium felis]|nr:hypothetical protein HWI79_2171 [Cryptosporidium felis]
MDSEAPKKDLFLPELITMMGPLLSGTLFPYNNKIERANANILFNSIKEESKKLLDCFSSAPALHVRNFLLNYREENPQIYLNNKQFVLTFKKRDDPCSWLFSNDDSNSSSKKHILISDLMRELQNDEDHWLGEILHSESKRIQSRVSKCKMRYGAILNFLVTNSSAIPILVQNKQRKVNVSSSKNNPLQSKHYFSESP